LHELIHRSQHDFISGKSCLTNLLEFLEFISKHVDKSLPVGAIYLDFKKVFDKVPHGRLMSKIRGCGVDNWINNWLNGMEQRMQFTQIGVQFLVGYRKGQFCKLYFL